MKAFQIIINILLLVCCAYMSICGFVGHLEPWMGGVGWFLLGVSSAVSWLIINSQFRFLEEMMSEIKKIQEG